MSRKKGNARVSELKVDKDCFVDEDGIESYVKVIVVVCDFFGVKVESIRMSESRKKGLHFYISISSPIKPTFANQLQWLLGDDAARVDFNRARIESKLPEWNKLFEVAGRRVKPIYMDLGEKKKS